MLLWDALNIYESITSISLSVSDRTGLIEQIHPSHGFENI